MIFLNLTHCHFVDNKNFIMKFLLHTLVEHEMVDIKIIQSLILVLIFEIDFLKKHFGATTLQSHTTTE